MKKVFIMRGVPGSGKSTEVSQLIAQYPNAKICSTDFYSMVNGEYKFDITKLGGNHKRNQRRFLELVCDGEEVVIVDNTNTTFKEYREYLVQGLFHGYDIEVIEFTPSIDDVEKLFERNVHGVPIETMVAMVNRFQPSENLFDDILVKQSMLVGQEKIEIVKKEIKYD